MTLNAQPKPRRAWPHALFVALSLAVPAWTSAQEAAPAEAPRPVMTAPVLLEAPTVTLAVDAEPLPPDTSVELLLTIGADGAGGAAAGPTDAVHAR